MAKIRKDVRKGPKTLVADTPKSIKELRLDENMVFSFIHLSQDQGATFKNWNDDGLLIKALERLKEYSCKKVSQTDTIYTIYGDFPPKTKYYHPKNVPPDANWARIHVDGTHIIAGHIVKNVFYVVFLDSDHSFWVTEKKHT